MVIHPPTHLVYTIYISTRVSRICPLKNILIVPDNFAFFDPSGRAFRDANSSSIGRGGLARYHLPYIGELADRWVGEE